MIEFSHVTKKLSNSCILEDINFLVNEGDIFGYLGPNGAGKTMSIRILMGLLSPNKGNVYINNKSADKLESRKKVGFCLDEDGLYWDLTAKENMEFFDRVYNIYIDRESRIKKLLNLVNLEDTGKKKVGEFSRGMKKRLALARALINSPELLVLDEPTTGLDPEGQVLIKDIIRSISKTTTIFFSSHNLTEVEEVCNRVSIINKKLLYCGYVKDNKESPIKLSVSIENSPKKIYLSLINKFGIKDYQIDKDILSINLKSTIYQDEIIKDIFDKKLKLIEVVKETSELKNKYFEIVREEVNE